MKKTIAICMLAMMLVISGCSGKSKEDTAKELINEVLVYAQTPPAEGATPDETVKNYETWLEEADKKFKDKGTEKLLELLGGKVFPKLATVYDGKEMPAEITNTTMEEKSGDSYYATVELKDKAGTAFTIKVRVQYKDKTINFMEVM